MVKIIIDKNNLAKLIEQGIKFSIVGDTQKKETPKEREQYIHELFHWWNNQNRIGGRKGLPKTRKILKTHIDAWNKVYRELYGSQYKEPIKEILMHVRMGLSNYIKDIKNRDNDNSYSEHRFTLYDFIKQKNGLQRFLSM